MGLTIASEQLRERNLTSFQ